MAFSGSGRDSHNSSLPTGIEIASFDTYDRAKRSIDFLVRQGLPIQAITIVGRDVQVVERITGKLTLPRVAFSGLIGGAWFGLFLGLLFSLTGAAETLSLSMAIALAAGLGMIFSVVMFSWGPRKRHYTTSSQVIAGSYHIVCDAQQVGEAKQLLTQMHLEQP